MLADETQRELCATALADVGFRFDPSAVSLWRRLIPGYTARVEAAKELNIPLRVADLLPPETLRDLAAARRTLRAEPERLARELATLEAAKPLAEAILRRDAKAIAENPTWWRHFEKALTGSGGWAQHLKLPRDATPEERLRQAFADDELRPLFLSRADSATEFMGAVIEGNRDAALKAIRPWGPTREQTAWNELTRNPVYANMLFDRFREAHATGRKPGDVLTEFDAQVQQTVRELAERERLRRLGLLRPSPIADTPALRASPRREGPFPPPAIVRVNDALDGYIVGGNGRYLRNPSAVPLDSLVREMGDRTVIAQNGVPLTGAFLFVVVRQQGRERILIANEYERSVTPMKLNHATVAAALEGNSRVLGAGMVYLEDGQLRRVTNETGHYETSPAELLYDVAPRFEPFRRTFAAGFEGFVDYRQSQLAPFTPRGRPTPLDVSREAARQLRDELVLARDMQRRLRADPELERALRRAWDEP